MSWTSLCIDLPLFFLFQSPSSSRFNPSSVGKEAANRSTISFCRNHSAAHHLLLLCFHHNRESKPAPCSFSSLYSSRHQYLRVEDNSGRMWTTTIPTSHNIKCILNLQSIKKPTWCIGHPSERPWRRNPCRPCQTPRTQRSTPPPRRHGPPRAAAPRPPPCRLSSRRTTTAMKDSNIISSPFYILSHSCSTCLLSHFTKLWKNQTLFFLPVPRPPSLIIPKCIT